MGSSSERGGDIPPRQSEEDETAGVGSAPPTQEAVALTPSQRSISISLTPPASSEQRVFWDMPPKYSVPPASLVSDRPLPVPSRRRALMTRLLFGAIAGAAVALLYYEASIVYGVSWQNPRLLLERIQSD